MVIKPVFNQKWSSVFIKIQNGFRCFSENHTRVANDFITDYADKKSRLKKTDYASVVDASAADSIASCISEGWKEGFVLEANPGPGVLSSSILKNGIKLLRVFEKNKLFSPALKALSADYPNFEIIEEDLMLLPVFESKTSSELESFFQNLPEHQWIDDIPLRVFSVITNRRNIKFLRFLLAVLPTRSSIFALGRCEFFVLTTEKEFMYMTALPKENFAMYRWSTVLYNLFFEIKCLQKFSSEIIFPLNSPHRKKVNSASDNLHLIQLTPKADLFSNVVYQNRLQDLYFFVRHHFIKRTALVIPTLESWIPLCGPRLIKDGMSVFTKFGDLSPYQMLLLFNQFSSWPEYVDSAFQAATHRYFSRGHYLEADNTKEQENVDKK